MLNANSRVAAKGCNISRNVTAESFQKKTAKNLSVELSAVEYDTFMFFDTPPHFTPKIGGRWLNFPMLFFCTWCPDEWSMFCSKPNVYPSNGLATAHD
jgi:hypothetical protein